MKVELVRSVLYAACAAWAAGEGLSASATTLTSVPMQVSMVMPMISYDAGSGTLSVMVDPTVPQLTPLLVSNPGDGFDPADPWYDFLDPSRQGLAFSGRYGFTMDTMSDPLPAGTAIWIRLLSSTPGLEAHRYRSTSPKGWEPIFGTAGTTNALQWDGTMFHPGFTAPAGTQTYTATFEAFLVDAGTGQPVPGASTGPFALNWTDVPDGRPRLCIGPKVTIAWPASATNYLLETSDAVSGAIWTSVTNTPVMLDGQPTVLLEPAAAGKFFRMRRAP